MNRKGHESGNGEGIGRHRIRRSRRLFARLALRVGRTVFGILPFARRVRAANDPKA